MMRRHTALVPILLLLLTVSPAFAWWNTSWTYRRAVTITNDTGATLTDFQVKIVVDTATLISEGKLNADCSDLRFVDGDDVTELNYYIEGPCNDANTIVWVRVPSIPAGGTTIYMYYGNPSATSESNAQAVFDWYDDASVDNSTSYVDLYSPRRAATLTTSYVYDTTNKYYCVYSADLYEHYITASALSTTSLSGFYIELNLMINSTSNFQAGASAHTDTEAISQRIGALVYHSLLSDTAAAVTGLASDTAFSFAAGTWYILRMYFLNGSITAEVLNQSGTVLSTLTYTSTSVTSATPAIYWYSATATDATSAVVCFSTFLVRKYADPEPSATVSTVEETVPPSTSVSVAITYTPIGPDALALDPENNINEVNVTWTVDVNTPYWNDLSYAVQKELNVGFKEYPLSTCGDGDNVYFVGFYTDSAGAAHAMLIAADPDLTAVGVNTYATIDKFHACTVDGNYIYITGSTYVYVLDRTTRAVLASAPLDTTYTPAGDKVGVLDVNGQKYVLAVGHDTGYSRILLQAYTWDGTTLSSAAVRWVDARVCPSGYTPAIARAPIPLYVDGNGTFWVATGYQCKADLDGDGVLEADDRVYIGRWTFDGATFTPDTNYYYDLYPWVAGAGDEQYEIARDFATDQYGNLLLVGQVTIDSWLYWGLALDVHSGEHIVWQVSATTSTVFQRAWENYVTVATPTYTKYVAKIWRDENGQLEVMALSSAAPTSYVAFPHGGDYVDPTRHYWYLVGYTPVTTTDYNTVLSAVQLDYLRVDVYDGNTYVDTIREIGEFNYVRTYTEIGDYVFRAVYDLPQVQGEVNDTVHIDMYPQNVAIVWKAIGITETNESFEFNGSATDNGTLSYSWDLGDGNTAAGQNVAHAYAAVGTYPVTLTVTDDVGLSKSTTVEISVGKLAIQAKDVVSGVFKSFDANIPELNLTYSDVNTIVLWSPYYTPKDYTIYYAQVGYLDDSNTVTLPPASENDVILPLHPLTKIIVELYDEDDQTEVNSFKIIMTGPVSLTKETTTGSILIDPVADLNQQLGEYTIYVYPEDNANYPINEYRIYYINMTREWVISNGANYTLKAYAVKADRVYWQQFKTIDSTGRVVPSVRVTIHRLIGTAEVPVAQATSQEDGTFLVPLSSLQPYRAEVEAQNGLLRVTKEFTAGSTSVVYIVVSGQPSTFLPPDLSLESDPTPNSTIYVDVNATADVNIANIRVSSGSGSILYIRYKLEVTDMSGDVLYTKEQAWDGMPSGMAWTIVLPYDENLWNLLAEGKRLYATVTLYIGTTTTPYEIHVAINYIIVRKGAGILESLKTLRSMLGPVGKIIFTFLVIIGMIVAALMAGGSVLAMLAAGLLGLGLLVLAGIMDPTLAGFIMLGMVFGVYLMKRGVLG